MKYLLVGINAKYIHSNLALQSLYVYAKKYSSVTPVVREFTINMPISDIVQGIYEEQPDFIGFSSYIWNSDMVLRVVKDIKLLLPDCIIYLGGPEVSYNSEQLLINNPEITGLMLGEGEQTFVELIKYYEGLSDTKDACWNNISSTLKTESKDKESLKLKSIDGLCYVNPSAILISDSSQTDSTSNIITTRPRAPINLSDVPFPYESLKDYENKIIYYETSRGCPYGCTYCLSSIDKSLRFRDMELVKKELMIFLDAKVPQVKLVDRTFNIDKKRSLELLSFLKNNDNGITNFHFEIAGDILTNEEISMINSLREGLIQLEIGVQTTNPCTLDAINRHTDLNKLTANVARLLSANNVHLHLDLIAGLPYEDLNSFRQSFNTVYSMHSHELQLGFLKVLKGAPINDLVNEQEIRYSYHAPYEVLSTKYLSYSDLCELKRVEEMLEIYHNSCQFIRSEAFLLELENSAYDMYLNLAQYYVNQKQLVIQCKRSVRYELLLNYAIAKHQLNDSDIAILRHLLTMDYYSRECAKARPSFAPDISEHKNAIRDITRQLSENAKNKGAQYHIEPALNNAYYIFDYSKRSIITGNVAPALLDNDQSQECLYES